MVIFIRIHAELNLPVLLMGKLNAFSGASAAIGLAIWSIYAKLVVGVGGGEGAAGMASLLQRVNAE